MPMYEYYCPICGYEFEVLQRMGEGNEKLKCPNCKRPRPEKKFSTFASQGTQRSISSSSCSAKGGFT